MMQVDTPRLILRDLVDADALAFVAYRSDPRFAGLYGPGTVDAGPDEARRLLITFERWRSESPRRNYQFGVFRRDAPGALIGCCGVRTADTADGVGDLGIELAPDTWGRYAYAVEIIDALLAFAFDRLQLREICGAAVSANKRVARLAKWFGAEEGAPKPGPDWMRDRGWCETDWRITRTSWLASSAARRCTRAAAERDRGFAGKP